MNGNVNNQTILGMVQYDTQNLTLFIKYGNNFFLFDIDFIRYVFVVLKKQILNIYI